MHDDRNPRSDVECATQLILRERQCRDRGWFEQMSDCYWGDSNVRLTWFNGSGPDFVAASARMAAEGKRNSHALGAVTVRRNDARYLIEAPAAISFYDETTGLAASVAWSRLVYRAEQRGEDLKISSLDVVYEREDPSASPDEAANRTPTSGRPYARAAQHLCQQGYEVDPDLLGEDRPRQLQAFYDEVINWLQHGGAAARPAIETEVTEVNPDD